MGDAFAGDPRRQAVPLDPLEVRTCTKLIEDLGKLQIAVEGVRHDEAHPRLARETLQSDFCRPRAWTFPFLAPWMNHVARPESASTVGSVFGD